ncbi:MAG: MBL fold metallo-hydrolase [Phycisphaerales bacterium]|nr:MBL fold metallo-hydrolase [Phycisphaerales bacterium]
MICISLQSGSNGNAIYVEADGVRLLFDAGISGAQAEGRLRVHQRDIRKIDALLVSHDHTDHIRCAGIYQRKYNMPVYLTRRTQEATYCSLGPLQDVHYFQSGGVMRFGNVAVHTIPTAHDAADGVAFVVEHNDKRLGIFTDLGHPFRGLSDVLGTLDAVFLESNYDPEMLNKGDYPWPLKQRISGPNGHLSNQEAANLLRGCGRRLRWAALAHLSEDNNDPRLALETNRRSVGRELPLYVASRYGVGEILTV